MARIAVIGAGMGAMAAAARLAVAGHGVTVYERAATYGGAVGRFERDGFVFDTGPGVLHVPAVYRDLFVKTGKEPLEACLDLVQPGHDALHVFADGTRALLPNASRGGVVAALDAAFGAGAGARWADFLGRAGDTWARARRPLLEEPLPADPGPLGRDPYPAPRQRRLLRGSRQASTLAEIGAWELVVPGLAALLDGYALGYGLDPRTAPASASVLPYLEQTFGVWYVRGGMRELARALYERCVARRVEFVFGAEVAAVGEKDGAVSGVELSDGVFTPADVVVAGAGPSAAPDLWGAGPARPPERGGGAAPGRFTVLLAVRGGRPAGAAHRTVVHAPSAHEEAAAVFGGAGGVPAQSPTVTVLRPDDASTRPDAEHEAVTVTATVAAQGPVDWTDAALRERYADVLVRAASAALPDLAERVVWREVRTPATTAAETGAPGGGVPAPALAGAGGRLLRPANTTGLRGLYLAGGRSHPGGGLPHAGMSGALVSGLIVEGPEFRGSQ
ncbi:phytoene desaturase family protein [Streptomyces sp. 8L]|uniref:phytoene desaturase family protein n=1 Tax=Streptomyces sp. 8L TaxID=2877242 RepID=UPI001CD7C0BA|nr:NAD(P)/FAD-dependent oxidoreductase [Streptomyces sp. 8L]MCA1221194.1 NAD(P)/FAD-dependent oxidoreductase [Streptomyces sp. 8L]